MPISSNNFTGRLVGASQQDITELNAALTYLQRSSLATNVLNFIKNNGIKIDFITPTDPRTYQNGNRYTIDNKTIYWDPDASTRTSGTSIANVGVLSAALLLLHEAAHAEDANLTKHYGDGNNNPTYDNNAEQYAIVQYENVVAQNLGETIRANHVGLYIPTKNPTEHTTTTGLWQEQNLDGQVTVTGNESFYVGTTRDPIIATFSDPNGTADLNGTIIGADNDTISIMSTDPYSTLPASPTYTINGNNDTVSASGSGLTITLNNSSTDTLSSGPTVGPPAPFIVDPRFETVSSR
jgi:hypothetical protein